MVETIRDRIIKVINTLYKNTEYTRKEEFLKTLNIKKSTFDNWQKNAGVNIGVNVLGDLYAYKKDINFNYIVSGAGAMFQEEITNVEEIKKLIDQRVKVAIDKLTQ